MRGEISLLLRLSKPFKFYNLTCVPTVYMRGRRGVYDLQVTIPGYQKQLTELGASHLAALC